MSKEKLKDLLKEEFNCSVSENYSPKDKCLNIYIHLGDLEKEVDISSEARRLEKFFRTSPMKGQIANTLKDSKIQRLVIGVRKFTPEVKPIPWSPRQGRDYKEYFFESTS